MAFQTKVDYCGLATVSSSLTIRDSNLNGSVEKYQPQGQNGSFVGTEVYGEDSAPSNSYGVSATVTLNAGALKLGKIITQDSKKYALETVTITTQAATAPAVSATAQEVETAADDTTMSHYSAPAISLTTKQVAQDVCSAVTISGAGCTLTVCTTTIACSVNKDKVAGTKIASDINSGVVTVTGTVLQTGSTAPTLTIASENGWVITKPIAITEANGETSYKTYSFEVQKVLAKDDD